MPGVAAPAKILVTGASGFLATHIISTLLSDGYTVVGTVRSTEKGDYLKDLYKTDKFSYAIVEDIEKEDAFDEVVKSGQFKGILHTASPFHFGADDPNELIGPAVSGTIGILKSAAAHGSGVQRAIITSSVAAIISPKPAPYTFTESDWNEASPKAVEEKGKKAPNGDKYSASKTLAERAAWDFVEKNKKDISFDLATINPPYIFGPVQHQMKDVDALNQSNAMFLAAITDPKFASEEQAGKFQGNFVDVRAVARAHMLALSKDVAGGERFIVSQGPFGWQDIYDALNEAGEKNVPKGHPGSQQRSSYLPQDGSKASRVLGLEYYSTKETAVETLKSLKGRFPRRSRSRTSYR